jgi:hypothetical protein
MRVRTFAIEKPGAVLSGKGKRLGKFADKLDDLGDVVFILTVLRPRLRVKKVISAGEELE